MSQPPSSTFLPAGLPPGWSVGPPPSLSALFPGATTSDVANISCLPPQHASQVDPSQALVPFGQLAPPPPGYICLPRNYASEQSIYPYIRNPYNTTTPHPPLPPSNARMPITATWRAPAPNCASAPLPLSALPSSSIASPGPPPFAAQTRQGEPFTVYHVCKLCQQARSIRYHREHPVDTPASVCHKCSKYVNDSGEEKIVKRRTTVHRKRSTTRPRHDSSEGEPRRRLRRSKHKSHRTRSRGRQSETTVITIYDSDIDSSSSSEDVEEQKPTAKGKPKSVATRTIYRYDKPEASSIKKTATQATWYQQRPQSTSSPPQVVVDHQADQKGPRQSFHVQNSPAACVDSPSASRVPSVPGSEVRRIAREEVRRYRALERRIDTHPRAFAHVSKPTSTAFEQHKDFKATALPYQTDDRSQLHSAEGSRLAQSAVYARTKETIVVAASRAPVQEDRSREKPLSRTCEPAVKQVLPARSETRIRTSARQEDIVAVKVLSAPSRPSEYSEFYDKEHAVRRPPTTPESYRRQASFETCASVNPNSSISQRPPKDAYQEVPRVRRRCDLTVPPSGRQPTVQSPPYSRLPKAMPAQAAFRDDQDLAIQPRRRLTTGQRPLKYDQSYVQLASGPREAKPTVPGVAPAPSRQPTCEDASDDEQKGGATRQYRRPIEDVRKRPSSPPREQVIHERRNVYHEALSPFRDRVTEERIIRSRRPPESGDQSLKPRHSSPPLRDRALPWVGQDRGRPSTRTNDQDAPRPRLRSILRSPSSSPRERDQPRTQPSAANRTAMQSPHQQVSFAETVNETILTPQLSSARSRPSSPYSSGRDPRGRLRMGPQLDGQNSWVAHGSDESEKYYYERTRRPGMNQRSELIRSELNRSSADTVPIETNTRFARVLSESPSRERLLSRRVDG